MGAIMQVRLLMLASSPRGGAAVDLDAGTLVRAHWTDASPVFEPYDVVEASSADDEELAFASDSVVASGPACVGTMRGRRAARLLRPIVHPSNQPLLGAAGPTVPYWTLRSDQPSVALLEPAAGPVVEREAGSSRLWCRFRWRRLDHDLPLDDHRLDERLSHPTATRLSGGTLARALGWKPDRLLVVLTPPREGVCHKVVAGMLPRP
ncbi:MAG: hypothetical protein QOF60_2151 [Actinomycetota bacterium]|jgi:hypothetical protein|nr:hypothetical protein [Actinomycetota bacterium]